MMGGKDNERREALEAGVKEKWGHAAQGPTLLFTVPSVTVT